MEATMTNLYEEQRRIIKDLKEKLAEANEVIEFCEGAIIDAIGCEDGLDGATGERILQMIKQLNL